MRTSTMKAFFVLAGGYFVGSMCALLWIYHGELDSKVGLGDRSRGLWKSMGNLTDTHAVEIQTHRMFDKVRSGGVRAKETFDGLWEGDDDTSGGGGDDNYSNNKYSSEVVEAEEAEEAEGTEPQPQFSFNREEAILDGVQDQFDNIVVGEQALALPTDTAKFSNVPAFFPTPMPKAEEGGFLYKLPYEAPICGPIHKQETKVSLATIATADRLWIISEYCSRWAGEISIVVYGDEQSGEKFINTIAGYQSCASSMGRLTITAQRPTDEEKEKPELFPINTLRNLAIENVKTSHYLYLDIDFWPSTTLYEHVHSKDSLMTLSTNPKTALVVPAFSRLDHDCKIKGTRISSTPQIPSNAAQINKCIEYYKKDMPTDKKSLENFIREEKAHTFDHWTVGAHGTTNANAWLKQRKGTLRDVKCIKATRYEPYLVLRRCSDLPPFQNTFTGYGKNKIQHILHLTRLGYKLSVLGGGFIIHFPHPASAAKVEWDAFVDDGHHENDRKKQQKLLKKMGLGVDDYHRLAMDNLLIQFVEWLEDVDGGEGGTDYCPGESMEADFLHMQIPESRIS